ncbi:MAG: twin-arginine translocase subunit TatC [Planctomycetes bacterium]|nr:twin-arginine translocase subunit TatC [Planctomycetota bacterium]
MSFGGHLDELRKRLFKSLGVIAVLFFGGWSFLSDQLTWVFMRPHRLAVEALLNADPPVEVNQKLIVLSPLEDLFFQLKASLMVSLLLGLPYLIVQIWGFVSVGLHEHERKPMRKFLPWSMLLAVAGMSFCYFVFFPTILEFLYGRLNTEHFQDGYQLKAYFGLYLMFTFALSLIFQLPLIMSGLGAAGVVDAPLLRKYRRHFILAAFVVGAMLTPPEPFSQFMMAVPTILLFEFGVLLVAFQGRRKAKGAQK